MSTYVTLDSDSASWLVGGGEMGGLMRAMDWATTPLGPSESWSPSLKMMARFLVANRFPLLQIPKYGVSSAAVRSSASVNSATTRLRSRSTRSALTGSPSLLTSM